ncbi:MAG: glycosyltransferase family 2 protein [Pirellulales bacterium]|nr:glycosyltransferase family 2 protein [Pirellulales bacterium]
MNTSSHYRISVIVPVHNRTALLRRALTSLHSQMADNFEVIVVDDGSDDNIEQIVHPFGRSRFRLVRQAKSGAAAARNLGVANSHGEYVTFLDSDDEALPTWLSDFDKLATSQHPQPWVVCLGARRVDDASGATTLIPPHDMGPLFKSITGHFLAGAYAIQRKLFEQAGGFDAQMPAGQHTELALRLCEFLAQQPNMIVNGENVGVVIHNHSEAKIRRDHRAILVATKLLLAKHEDAFANFPRLRSKQLATAAVSAYKLRLRRESLRLHWQACRTDIRNVKNWARLCLTVLGIRGMTRSRRGA